MLVSRIGRDNSDSHLIQRGYKLIRKKEKYQSSGFFFWNRLRGKNLPAKTNPYRNLISRAIKGVKKANKKFCKTA